MIKTVVNKAKNEQIELSSGGRIKVFLLERDGTKRNLIQDMYPDSPLYVFYAQILEIKGYCK